jgi:hypothetical protein
MPLTGTAAVRPLMRLSVHHHAGVRCSDKLMVGRQLPADGVTLNASHRGVVTVLVGRYLHRFFSPSEYEKGQRALLWAGIYLVVTWLVIISAVADANPDAESGLLAFAATLPLSLVVINAEGGRMLVALAVCAFINAFVFWVVFRGSSHYPRRRWNLRR